MIITQEILRLPTNQYEKDKERNNKFRENKN